MSYTTPGVAEERAAAVFLAELRDEIRGLDDRRRVLVGAIVHIETLIRKHTGDPQDLLPSVADMLGILAGCELSTPSTQPGGAA